MKKLKEVIEVENQGLISLLGKKVLVICNNYFYYGTLSGVNDNCIELTEPYKVFETGAYSDKAFKDAQRLPVETWLVMTAHIESVGESFKNI